MNAYTNGLTAEQKKNINFMVTVMSAKGITNTFMQAGILAVASKESAFVPKEETGFQSTSNEQIRKIFRGRVSSLSEEALTKTKSDPKAFFDLIYGGRFGNAADEGYKYRGRGMNQFTFKGNYAVAKKYTDVDIVQFPDKLNELEVATDVLIGYFKDNLTSSKARLSEYGMTCMNEAAHTASAVGVAYHANAGWGKVKAEIDEDLTGGLAKSKSRVDELYDLIKSSKSGL
jgi:putative chitinase